MDLGTAGTNLDESRKQLSGLLVEGEASVAKAADELANSERSMDAQEKLKVVQPSQSLDDDAALAAKLQALYDQEQTQRLPVQSFECEICLETLAHDYIVQFERCQHSYCRDCIRIHISSTLTERRYPILCPSCVAEKAEEAAAIDYEMFEILGATAEEIAVFEELQLTTHSIPIQCQKCKETIFLDREDYRNNEFIICPMPRCHYVWCKKCLQEVGPTHTCDGMAELDQLMKNQGWKYCPACRTPIQKINGCDHIVCTARGCSTQFCYRCGQVATKHNHDCQSL